MPIACHGIGRVDGVPRGPPPDLGVVPPPPPARISIRDFNLVSRAPPLGFYRVRHASPPALADLGLPPSRRDPNCSQFDAHASKLTSSYKPKDRLALVTEVRDAIEVVNTSEYPKFLSAFLPAFGAVLDAVPAQTEDNVEHKVRKTVLEMLNKLPHNEHLRPHDKTVLAMATKALRAENEENALVCLRVIFDLHRNFRPSLEFEVEPFLEFVRSVYENVEETVKATFGEPGAGAETTKEKKKGEKDAEAPSAVATLSTRSFKVQTECPLIVMLLFQLYARLIPANVTALLPLMVKMIGLKGPDLKDVPNRLRGAYGDLKGAQVKTVSFVTYLLRGYAESVQPHRDAVSVSIVELLRSCPDNVSTRKELLVATRHVLSAPDFRRGFFAHLDALLD